MRTIGLKQLDQMKFDRLPFEGEWRKAVGNPTKNFSAILYGNSGNGKTTGIILLVKYVCSFGLRACYISHEEGVSGTMQDAFNRQNMMSENSGQIVLAEDASFEETLEYFSKRGSPEVAIIDSIDHCDMTKEQYIILRQKLKKKIIILVAWSQGSRPKTQAAKDIEYMVDVKLFVKNFMIWPKSRFGGNEPFVIWEQRARLLEQKYFLERDKQERLTLFSWLKPTENTIEGGGVDANG